jgi:hypothetical protein
MGSMGCMVSLHVMSGQLHQLRASPCWHHQLGVCWLANMGIIGCCMWLGVAVCGAQCGALSGSPQADYGDY